MCAVLFTICTIWVSTLLFCSTAVNEELLATGEFEKLSRSSDETEHSIELHLPYIAKVMERYNINVFALSFCSNVNH